MYFSTGFFFSIIIEEPNNSTSERLGSLFCWKFLTRVHGIGKLLEINYTSDLILWLFQKKNPFIYSQLLGKYVNHITISKLSLFHLHYYISKKIRVTMFAHLQHSNTVIIHLYITKYCTTVLFNTSIYSNPIISYDNTVWRPTTNIKLYKNIIIN